jgi:hypothetical protein
MKSAPEVLVSQAPDVPPRVRRLVVGLAAVLTACALVGTALSPYLLVEHPLLLIGLNPDSRHLVLAANRVDMGSAVAVGALRRGLNFMVSFGLASLYGHVVVAWLDTKRSWVKSIVRFVESVYRHLGVWLVVFVPLYWVAVFAGAARLSWRKFAIAIVPGQILFVYAFLRFGEAIEGWTEPIIAFVTKHPVETTLAAVAAVAVQQIWSRLRKRSSKGGEPTPDKGAEKKSLD